MFYTMSRFIQYCLLKHSHFAGVTDYTVCERITLNWSARSCLMWNYAFKSFKYINKEDNIYKELNDISILTKRRAILEYGLLVSGL